MKVRANRVMTTLGKYSIKMNANHIISVYGNTQINKYINE